MPHFKSVHVKRFRRVENLRLDDLGSVNILVGRNNSGKTSVLEALAIASHPNDAFTWIDTAREREMKSARTPVLEVLSWIFPRTELRTNGFEGTVELDIGTLSGETLEIHAGYREYRELDLTPVNQGAADLFPDDEELHGNTALLTVETRRVAKDGHLVSKESSTHEFRGRYRRPYSDFPLYPCQLVSPVSHRTSRQLLETVDRVLEERLKPEVISLLQILAPDVDDIEIRSPQGRGAVVQLHHDGIGHVPLAVEGDGMRRALAFAAAAVSARDGILLLDEVETALHPDALGRIFKFLIQACKISNVQLFVSTHSLEAVDAMIEGAEEHLPDLVAYRLPARDSGALLKRFGGRTLHDLRHEGGLDIR